MSKADAIAALRMKQSIAYASIKKIATMLACAGPADNKVRGMLQFHGATTGRWSHTLIQLGNIRRSTMKESEQAYRDICGGISREMLELTYGPVMEVLANTMRHYVHDACQECGGTGDGDLEVEGIPSCRACGGTMENPFIGADFSAIEARLTCWLAGEEWALDEYRQGIDRYKRMASVIYGIPEEQVNKHPQRFIGKQCILLSGYQGGPAKFRQTCEKFGYKDMPEGLEDKAVGAFRRKHKATVKLWRATQNAAWEATICKNKIVHVVPKHEIGEPISDPLPKFQPISFLHKDIGGMPFLLMKLPSGRNLAYPKPRIIASRKKGFEGSKELVFFGHIIGAQWGDVGTYGGKLVENMCQAVATDLMMNGIHQAEKHGYKAATTIHDEVVCYSEPGQTAEELVKHLTTLPEWAAGLPLAAEGEVIPFYKK